jgi:hypothetical protein
MIAKLVKARYLLSARPNDADAMTGAIAEMKHGLRDLGNNRKGPNAA